MQRLHTYPDIRAMFRRLLIATVTGVLAALAVAVFRHSMYLLEWLFLSNDSGSLVNAAAALSPWRRMLTPALGGLAAGLLLWGWQRLTAQRPHAPRIIWKRWKRVTGSSITVPAWSNPWRHCWWFPAEAPSGVKAR